MSIRDTRQSSQQDDEIDLLELLIVIWGRRYLILSLVALCGTGGFIYATYHPGKPDIHVAKVMVEIGRYKNSELGGIDIFEPPADLAAILKQNINIQATPSRGTRALLELEASHPEPAIARQQLDEALAFIQKRHQDLAEKLDTSQRLRMSQAVAEPVYTFKSVKDKRLLITAMGACLGALASLFIIFMGNAMQKRRVASNPGSF